MALEYVRAESIVYSVLELVHDATGVRVYADPRTTHGDFQAGLYQSVNDRIFVGTKMLAVGQYTGFVSCIDCLSMCKQCLHEYRHWQQRQMFAGFDHDPSKYGFTSMPFGDDPSCRTMARQRLIASEFPAYQQVNQFVLSYERDAEEYAVRVVPDIMRSVGFPEDLIEPCLVSEINRRMGWYGDQPVATSASAAEDLRTKKRGPCEARLPLDYEPGPLFEVSKTFRYDEKAQADYNVAVSGAGSLADGDRFLLDYIARHDPKVFGLYCLIRDEMPKLSAFEKMQRQLYRTSHGLPDVNDYDVLEL